MVGALFCHRLVSPELHTGSSGWDSVSVSALRLSPQLSSSSRTSGQRRVEFIHRPGTSRFLRSCSWCSAVFGSLLSEQCCSESISVCAEDRLRSLRTFFASSNSVFSGSRSLSCRAAALSPCNAVQRDCRSARQKGRYEAELPEEAWMSYTSTPKTVHAFVSSPAARPATSTRWRVLCDKRFVSERRSMTEDKLMGRLR